MSINTEFEIPSGTLSLTRYPVKHQHKSLQAWDSADQLVLAHINNNPSILVTKQQASNLTTDGSLADITIFNDEFGALACGLLSLNPSLNIACVSDSWISHKATQKNLQRNEITKHVTFKTSTDEIQNAAVILIKVPRSLALLELQLAQISQTTAKGTHIIAAAKVTALKPSVFKLFEKYLGAITTSLAKKKSRLLFCDNEKYQLPSPKFPTAFTTDKSETGIGLTLVNHANVFSRQSLDLGARFMLKSLPDLSSNPKAHVIDLGCGNGVLGIALLARYPQISMTFVDESFMAIESAQLSVEKNLPDALNRCRFVATNCLEGISSDKDTIVDLVICNPPFHQQNTVTEHIAWQMFHDAFSILSHGGELRVVANRHLPHAETLKKRFGGVSVVASERKFVILSAVKKIFSVWGAVKLPENQ